MADDFFGALPSTVRKCAPHIVLAPIVVFLFIGCRSQEAPKEEIPASEVTVSIVYPPETEAIVTAATQRLEAELQQLPDGSTVKVTLTAMEGLAAAKKIASGELKSTAWLSPSQFLVDYTNESLKNLGPPQRNCARLFYTPIVLISRAALSAAILRMQASTISFDEIRQNLIQSTAEPSPLGSPRPLALTLGIVSPDLHAAALGSALQMILMSLPQRNRSLGREDVLGDHLDDALKVNLGSISKIASTTNELVHWSIGSPDQLAHVAVVAEQSYLVLPPEDRNNLKRFFTRDGALILDYTLCLSQADWVGAAERKVLSRLAELLQTDETKRTVLQSGFRLFAENREDVSDQDGTQAQSDGSVDDSKRGDLPVSILRPPAGDLVQYVLDEPKRWLRPVSLLLVLETSGGMAGEKLLSIRSSLQRIIRTLPSSALITLVTFDRNTDVRVERSSSADEVMNALNDLHAGGGSALLDAVKRGLDLSLADDLATYRHEVLVITDGSNIGSHTQGASLVDYGRTRLAQSPINVTVITFNGSTPAMESVNELLRVTGGNLIVKPPSEMDSALQEYFRTL